MIRLLLDPAPDASGGGTAALPVAAAATPTPTPAPAPAGTTNKVEVTAEEYKALLDTRTKLAEIEATKEREAGEARQREIDALAKKGEVEAALAKLRETSAADLEKERARGNQIEVERLSDQKAAFVGKAISTTVFVSDAARDDAIEKLEYRLEAVRDPATGTVTVRDKKTGQDGATFVKAWLDSASHLRKASTTGGAGATGGDRTTPTPGSTDTKPPTASDLLIARERERLANPDNSFYGLTRSRN